ncbi:hypothetical protein XU18_2372 [Perkinsela sp. CCAP 1560/4]|nr:hypothetical protein XU18_2372 [Perkinsela sp. CCAP 1560/4]|eukprot:KNH06862.1 hypothetical protein XU18_2372 [Perkinsela sp. CCAP 1560/4]
MVIAGIERAERVCPVERYQTRSDNGKPVESTVEHFSSPHCFHQMDSCVLSTLHIQRPETCATIGRNPLFHCGAKDCDALGVYGKLTFYLINMLFWCVRLPVVSSASPFVNRNTSKYSLFCVRAICQASIVAPAVTLPSISVLCFEFSA